MGHRRRLVEVEDATAGVVGPARGLLIDPPSLKGSVELDSLRCAETAVSDVMLRRFAFPVLILGHVLRHAVSLLLFILLLLLLFWVKTVPVCHTRALHGNAG